MSILLTPEQIECLKKYNTPTISNAIETFNVRPRHVGFLPHYIRCLLPDVGVIVGYAVTSQTRALPATEKEQDVASDYFRYVAQTPGPKIAVGEDLDNPPGLGAQFGEVTATIHKKLGCVGHITSGCPRDIDEVAGLNFGLYGLNPCVSHGYVRMIGFGRRVTIGGVDIHPGDLLHCDKHGVCIVPHEIAPRLAEACAMVEKLEKPLLDICKGDDFDLEEYLRRRVNMKNAINE